MMRYFRAYLLKHIELLFWVAALVLLFFMDTRPGAGSLCFFHWIGIDHCPGCGIGHSMHAALRLEMLKSFQTHPMGIVAILIIFNRIKQLLFLPKTIEL